MTFDWNGRKVLVTGGHGFLGTVLTRLLHERGATVASPTHGEIDLEAGGAFLRIANHRPDVFIHAAARCGGLGYVAANRDTLFERNARMSEAIFHACREAPPSVLVAVGSSCMYPGDCALPLREEQVLEGAPHSSVEPYGTVKRHLYLLSQVLEIELAGGTAVVYPVLANLYGPGAHLSQPERLHFADALALKFALVAAGTGGVNVWGTGVATRELLYVEDAARGILHLIEHGATGAVNLGGNGLRTVGDVVERLCQVSGVAAERVRYDGDPGRDGQPTKVLDWNKARTAGWGPTISFDEGIRRTYEAALDFVRDTDTGGGTT